MSLREKDIDILLSARDDDRGDLNRNALVEAFKRAGATIVRTPDNIRIQFRGKSLQYDLPMGNGPVDLTGRHPAFRKILRELSQELLLECGITQ
jgi:hypothetical protein